MNNDKLCKRYLFNLEMIVKGKATNKKIEGPPRMLYLRELFSSIHQIFKEQILAVVRSVGCWSSRHKLPPFLLAVALIESSERHGLWAAAISALFTVRPSLPATACAAVSTYLPCAQRRNARSRPRPQAGPEAVQAGDRCVLMKERGVMVVGLSIQEWRVLLEKNTGSDKMQMISGVEEAVMRGLSQSEGTSDSQTDLKTTWNSWALKLCEMEGGSPHLRSKCLLQRTVLLLQQQMHQKALESATEVLKLYPESKHACALLATSQHKAGKKKESALTVSELVVAFQRAEDTNMLSDELGYATQRLSLHDWHRGSPASCDRRSLHIRRHPLELTVALLVEMHRTKDALKLLASLLSRVHGARQQHLFFGLARLYAKHGLNKDALVGKLPSLCSMPPDRRTWELLKSMAEVSACADRYPPHLWCRIAHASCVVSPIAAVHANCCGATVTEIHRRGGSWPLHPRASDH